MERQRCRVAIAISEPRPEHVRMDRKLALWIAHRRCERDLPSALMRLAVLVATSANLPAGIAPLPRRNVPPALANRLRLRLIVAVVAREPEVVGVGEHAITIVK